MSKLLLSMVKATIGVLLFIVIYNLSNITLIKEYAQIDKPFELLNNFLLENDSVKTKSPHVMLFGIDNYYLKSQNLIDEDNKTNYGYLFPNDKIAQFITKIDRLSEALPKEKQPKAMFIDYDFSFTTAIYGKDVTREDSIFIKVLKEPRNYTILLPKISKYNYIESLADKKIQELIRNKKIVFVSVSIPYSKDSKTRRYIPYTSYKDSLTNQEHNYTSVSVEMWHLFNQDINISKEFKEQDMIENNFIIKSYRQSLLSKYHKPSNWKMLDYYSANYSLEDIDSDNFDNALILLGSIYDKEDMFQVTSSSSKLSGIEVHANILMTLFYFDGKLKQFDIYKSSFLVFITFIMLFWFTDRVLKFLPTKSKIFLINRGVSKLMISLFITSVVMGLLSWFILIYYKEWFNWFIPVLLFELTGVIVLINRYILKKFIRKIK